jgi:hypothetical protein
VRFAAKNSLTSCSKASVLVGVGTAGSYGTFLRNSVAMEFKKFVGKLPARIDGIGLLLPCLAAWLSNF